MKEQNHMLENAVQRDRLEMLLEKLNEENWLKDLGGGWTIGTMLCHLSFWDRMTAVRIHHWLKTGRLTPIPDDDNIDAINDSTRYLFSAIPLEGGRTLILETTREIDNLIAGLTDEKLAQLDANGRERWYRRYFHRQDHLDRIEKSLGL